MTARGTGGTDAYLSAAVDVARWLDHVAIEEDGGLVAWPAEPDVSPATSDSLYTGVGGPVVFLSELYRLTGEDRYLDLAVGGSRWLSALLRMSNHGEGFDQGLLTGVAGYAVVFSELARAGVDATDELADVFDALVAQAITTDAGLNWMGYTDIAWGTAGVGFVLLDIGVSVLGDQAVDLATGAGDWLLSDAHEAEPGIRWDIGPTWRAQDPQTESPFCPNFGHGSAGIAAYLARLSTITGERRFRDAALAGARWILSTCRTEEGGCAAPWMVKQHRGDYGMGPMRAPDDDRPLYTFGWCHGPPGLGSFFRELELATGDAEWAEWIRRTATALRLSGIPERQEPGFWDNVGRCCGSAGVAEYFMDLDQWSDDPDHLTFAKRMVDDILDRALTDEHGMRWSNVEIRRDPPELPSETGFFTGASGIASTLLRMRGAVEGLDQSHVRLPHTPRWRDT